MNLRMKRKTDESEPSLLGSIRGSVVNIKSKAKKETGRKNEESLFLKLNSRVLKRSKNNDEENSDVSSLTFAPVELELIGYHDACEVLLPSETVFQKDEQTYEKDAHASRRISKGITKLRVLSPKKIRQSWKKKNDDSDAFKKSLNLQKGSHEYDLFSKQTSEVNEDSEKINNEDTIGQISPKGESPLQQNAVPLTASILKKGSDMNYQVEDDNWYYHLLGKALSWIVYVDNYNKIHLKIKCSVCGESDQNDDKSYSEDSTFFTFSDDEDNSLKYDVPDEFGNPVETGTDKQ